MGKRTDIGQRKIGKKCYGRTNRSLRCLDHTEEHLWDAEQLKRCWKSAWCHLSSMVGVTWWSGVALVLVRWEICSGLKGFWIRKAITPFCNAMPYPVDSAWLEPFHPTTGQWPKAHLQVVQELFREEAGSWYSICNGVARAVTRSKPHWAVVGAAWPYGTQEVPIQPIQLVGGASRSVGWNFSWLPQQINS